MPRTSPTHQIDTIGNLEINPERGVGDFLQSKNQEEYVVKHPNWNSAGESIELLFIRNEREHGAMLRLQQEILENSQRLATLNTHRIRKMSKIQNNLRKRFIQVNGFSKECYEKKRVADRKVKEEKEKHETIRQEIKECKDTIKELKVFRETMRNTVHSYKPYERIMDEVVEASDIFESVKDCMDRCDALMMAQMDICDLAAKKLLEIEETRKRMIVITNEAALTVLGLRTDLAELERSYNSARNECLRLEKTLQNAKNITAQSELNTGRTLDAVYVVYRMLCSRRNRPLHFRRQEVERQLDYIMYEVEIIQRVLQECNKLGLNSVKEEQFYAHKDSTKC